MNNSSSNKYPPGGGRFLTIQDVAEILGVSARTIRRWIGPDGLRVHRFGKAVRIAQDDLLLFQAKHRK
jgi:excisionase family DNA binding protein